MTRVRSRKCRRGNAGERGGASRWARAARPDAICAHGVRGGAGGDVEEEWLPRRSPTQVLAGLSVKPGCAGQPRQENLLSRNEQCVEMLGQLGARAREVSRERVQAKTPENHLLNSSLEWLLLVSRNT